MAERVDGIRQTTWTIQDPADEHVLRHDASPWSDTIYAVYDQESDALWGAVIRVTRESVVIQEQDEAAYPLKVVAVW